MAEVSIFLNCGPILTVVLGGIFLSTEHVTRGTVAKVVAAFAGVLLITFGAPKTTQSAISGLKEITWFNYVLMTLMPLLIALGNLAMGELRRLDPILIPFYSNIGILSVSLVVCLVSEGGFFPDQKDLNVHGVLLFLLIACFCNGVSMYFSWVLKSVGFTYDRVTRVSPLFYLESAIALCMDITVFKVHFAKLQILGLAIIIGSFCVIIASAYLAE